MHATQYYSVVEDLAQPPCAMSTLEIIQMCPTQRKNLLPVLGAMDTENINVIAFKLEDFKSRLFHQLYFQLSTKFIGKKVHRTVLDEGSSTSVMSLSCWRAIGSPEVNHSPTTLKAFDGHDFQPYGLLPTIHFELGGKLVSIHIDVIDTHLDYNLLLGHNWFYAMKVVASTIF